MADINGTQFDDNLVGTNASESISGLGGNDTLTGLNGNDRLFAGPGNDRLVGGNGNDQLDAGAGNDVLIGGVPNPVNGEQDNLIGRTGSDQFVLGTNLSVFYRGNDSFAIIRDFDRNEGDKVVLKGSASDYRATIGNFGADTFLRTTDNNLIARLEGVTNFSFSLDTIFV
ncbi:calcium-binding protein [Nostoc sp. LPT]|uniref:calcium-binding protein n=1 Tax=Nostoc sp. LPT TaxID=2815387 RepID=UPI001D376686|nr:calcium-binding protein [Nostoc sp. LPT]MBN4001341.1 hypothetical protein [Nostoc sp. LPT]